MQKIAQTKSTKNKKKKGKRQKKKLYFFKQNKINNFQMPIKK